MVSIRLQRRGRRGQAQFRLVVQDSRRSPVSGRVIANLGFYNPHSKEHGVNLEKVAFYLEHGAQPSKRVIKFLIEQKVDLPSWVQKPVQKKKKVRYPDKLRRNQTAPTEKPAAVVEEKTPAAEEVVEKTTNEKETSPQKAVAEAPKQKAPAKPPQEKAEEKAASTKEAETKAPAAAEEAPPAEEETKVEKGSAKKS